MTREAREIVEARLRRERDELATELSKARRARVEADERATDAIRLYQQFVAARSPPRPATKCERSLAAYRAVEAALRPHMPPGRVRDAALAACDALAACAPTADDVRRAERMRKRNAAIRRDWNGRNTVALARRHRLSTRQVRRIARS